MNRVRYFETWIDEEGAGSRDSRRRRIERSGQEEPHQRRAKNRTEQRGNQDMEQPIAVFDTIDCFDGSNLGYREHRLLDIDN